MLIPVRRPHVNTSECTLIQIEVTVENGLLSDSVEGFELFFGVYRTGVSLHLQLQ